MHHATDLCRTAFVHRNNTVANELKSLCCFAGLQYQSEVQCIPGSLDVPADLYICKGPGGIPIAVDVTVGSPVCDSATKALTVISKAGSYLSRKETDKLYKYKEHFASVNGTIQFLPFVMSSFGGVAGQAKELVSFISRALAKKMLMPLQSAHSLVSNQVSAALMNFVALKLSHAVASLQQQQQQRVD